MLNSRPSEKRLRHALHFAGGMVMRGDEGHMQPSTVRSTDQNIGEKWERRKKSERAKHGQPGPVISGQHRNRKTDNEDAADSVEDAEENVQQSNHWSECRSALF